MLKKKQKREVGREKEGKWKDKERGEKNVP